MRVAYFDCFSGASGDMILGSLLDAGLSFDDLRQDVAMARRFKPMTAKELEKHLAETKVPGSDGKLELWKTTRYGSAYHFKQHEG